MTAAPHPRMHGLTHVRGGPDPIPGLQTGAPPSSLEGAYLTQAHLEAWWRLGEDTPFPVNAASTPNFMADSSPHGRNLTAINRNTSGGIYITDPAGAGLPTTNAAGALTEGDPSINDGGILFNINMFQWTQWGYGVYLASPSVKLDERLYCGGSDGHGFSVTCWVKFRPTNTPGIVNSFAPYAADGSDIGFRPLFGDFAHQFGNGSYGTKVGLDPFYGNLTYMTYNYSSGFYYKTAFGLVPNAWYFLAMTLDRTTADGVTPALYKRRLLLNGTELKLVEGDASAVGLAAGGGSTGGLTLGCANDDDLRIGFCAGGLDEFSIWSKALTDVELFGQQHSKVQNEGDTWSTTTITAGPAGTHYTIESGSAPAGSALTADGSGGTEWSTSITPVYLNGV